MINELPANYTVLLSGISDVKAVVIKGLLDFSEIDNVVRYRHVPYEEVIIGGIDDEVDVYVKTDEFHLATLIIDEHEGRIVSDV